MGLWNVLERISAPNIFYGAASFNGIIFLFDEEYST
jgi:hypothetical protein